MMPFSSNKDLPTRIKKMFPSTRLQAIFRRTFNSVFASTKNESRAIAIATSAANKAKSKSEKNSMKVAKAIQELRKIKIIVALAGLKKVFSKKNKKLYQQIKIVEYKAVSQLSSTEDLIIEGVALQEGTFHGIFYSAEVLKKVAGSFIGKSFKMEHTRGLLGIVGKVIDASFDAAKRAILFTATIFDETAKRLLREKLAKNISVGIEVDTIINEDLKREEVISGEGKEISLVEDPACKTCGIDKIQEKNN